MKTAEKFTKQTRQQKLLEMKNTSDAKVSQLKNEVEVMKHRIKLVSQKQKANERFRQFKKDRHQLAALKAKSHETNSIAKLQIAHSRQKNVLKRKMEEAASVRARSELHKLKRQNAETCVLGMQVKVAHNCCGNVLEEIWRKSRFKQNLSHEVAARASLTKKWKRFSDRAVMGAATKSGNYEVALQYTAPELLR